MILIVSSRFDKTGEVIKGLQDSCIQFLNNKKESFDLFEVPGAVELPIAIQELMLKDPLKYEVAIALGCVIKGESDHYEWVTSSCRDGLGRVALKLGKPVVQGVLACPNEALAIARKNLGAEYAHTAIEMRDLLS
ncbi:MAG TPA: 6,7-dimethyl-8-ribityllumazine synthase [Candidatus Gracilibacteria bacterium]